MQVKTHGEPDSARARVAGWIISGLVIAFMLFDGAIKLLKLPSAIQGTTQLGYPANVVFPLGLLVVGCVIVYALPRSAVLGAILLTGYFGGATATQVRVQSLWFIFPIVIGVLAWLGLFLRDRRLRQIIPLCARNDQS
jgi:hypothetical protein